MTVHPAILEEHEIRRVYDEATETWWFSVVDIIQLLTQQADYQTARKYWNKLKERLVKEGSQSVTKCHRLKLAAADGKRYLTEIATGQTCARGAGKQNRRESSHWGKLFATSAQAGAEEMKRGESAVLKQAITINLRRLGYGS